MLVLLSFRFEPLLATLRMEEVTASGDAHDRHSIDESVHANDTVLAIEFINLLSITHIFK